jgi:hypothetical protein
MVKGEGGSYILVGLVGVYLGLFYFYDGYAFIIMLNMGLFVSVKVSFICNFCLLKLYMWNRSSVLSNWPFFSICNISSVWSIVTYVCPM